jgi:hypothetical protein
MPFLCPSSFALQKKIGLTIEYYFTYLGRTAMKRCILLSLMCGFVLGSCGWMQLVCDVTVINTADYEATDIKLTYIYVNGNTLFGDGSKHKTKALGVLPPGSRTKETLTFSDPVLMTCTSPMVIEYYLNGVKYGGDTFDADYPVGTLLVSISYVL